ncbi:hypothetical protein QQS21_008054 [Conoideocrella luteorostrata]|uniref:Uncharacterized protein n=1 Tax=Conoideocrella luteorostrata TaxID=1105319 RepID=A0AAJ0CJM8_9HYPO|nr:hypothetical protein QQS21_008054 [Conoideocrella luteorostrata]
MSSIMAVQAPAKSKPSSSSVATKPESNNDIPSLSFSVLTKDTERQDAMRLVTDSIAQQRQIASFSVIIHPACLAGLVAGCASIYRLNAKRDFGTALTMICGLILAYLAAVRLLTANYIRLAESLKWKEWIANPGGSDDYILAARFGDEIIATLVLRIVAPAGSNKKTRLSSVQGGSGIIRAWTTKRKYRNKGIGGDMLRLAILTTRSKCSDSAQVAFDPDHANSARPLHEMFNRPFIKRDTKATKALKHALSACDRGDSSFQE